MSYLVPFFYVFISLRRNIPRIVQLGLSLLFGIGIVVFLFNARANAAATVLLQYRDLKLALPLQELQAFANAGTPTPALQDFLEKAQENPEEVRRWLTTKISPGPGQFLPEEFTLLQINKTLGDPLQRQDLAPLATALRKAYRTDSAFSLLEVLEQYPKPEVGLVLNRLERVYTDVELFVTRIQPVLTVAKQLLPELVCDCTISTIAPPSSDRFSPIAASFTPPNAVTQTVDTSIASAQTRTALKSWFEVDSRPLSALASETVGAGNSPAFADKRLVFAFGLFRPSISIEELTRFVETGELSPGWRFYFNLAKIDRDSLRKALSQSVAVDLRFLDRTLNSLPGEFLLYELGQIAQTPSGLANIQAARSAMILSAADDNRFSMLELLQHYPTPQLQINGTRLVRLGKNVSRLRAPGGVAGVVLNVESWLVQLQASAAEEICNCEQNSNAAPVLPEVADLPAATVTQFLPPNWQPVGSHRQDRGLIKVVWLQGTPYEMGYQHGQLLHDEIASLGKEVIQLAEFLSKGFALGRLASKRTYADVIEECRGLTDATQDLGITLDTCLLMAYSDVFQEILGYTLPQELFWEGCNQFVAANRATIDGRLYHGSSVDNDAEPVPYVMNNPVIFVRQPNVGLPHVFVTYPGVVWPNSGMNVAGISLGLDTAHPNGPDELSLEGRSNVQIMAKILQSATSFAEARRIMETQPRVRANLIMITDGKSKQAGVFEFTGKSLGVRELQANGVVYVTNHFVLPEMYEKQPLPVDPSSASRFERFQQLLEPDRPSSYYGQIQPETMATVLRDRVNPKTQQASPLTVFDDDASPGGNGALRQAIYDPERLLLWIAAGPAPVPENPFVCFSVGELLGFPNAARCESPAL